MNIYKTLLISNLSFILAGSAALADELLKPESIPAGQNMYVIERDMPGLGKLTPEELKAASQTSCRVVKSIGKITWLYSYVTGDKMYCVYLSPNPELVREHAKEGGFPANAVNRVTTVIGPKTAE